jgi:hypothetical protein
MQVETTAGGLVALSGLGAHEEDTGMVRPMALAHGFRNRLFVLCVITGLCGISCKQMFQWSGADDFRASLRCGMSVREVTALAKKYGAEGIKPSESTRADGLQAFSVEQRNTRFYLGFQGDALIKVQKARGYGMTGLELLAEEDLCGRAVGPLSGRQRRDRVRS